MLEENGQDTGRSGAVTFGEGVPVLANGIADEEEGGEWYYEASTKKFWTWDTPEFIAQKFEKIVKAKSLGGISKLKPTTFLSRFFLFDCFSQLKSSFPILPVSKNGR